jgi:uncharacterized membrane protein
MKLSESGESRIRGYLFVLNRSLASFMPREMAQDSVREVESHILERMAQVEGTVDERTALEKVLSHLGPPMKVAQAYAAEITFDEAVATGRPLPIFRALWLVSTTVRGFFTALILFVGYAVGLAFLIVAALKPIFPNNVGLIMRDGVPTAFGAVSSIGSGVEVVGGYALIPLCLLAGSITLLVTHRLARAFVAWWRERMEGPTGE